MTERVFSFTTKINGDLFTVGGATAEEFDNNLTAAIIGGLHDKAAALQEVIHGTAAIENTAQVVERHAAPATVEHAAPPQVGLEVVKDRWGNAFTYGHPDAPDLPDGRGKYIQKSGTSKAGKPYTVWVDPAKGPKPARPGATEAEPIWVR